jgi:two-component system, OmpR family, alkaline phosphatase synthesis response regulator PhoP
VAEPATVLVVEDDRALCQGLALNLRRAGYRVLTATDGQAGMRQAFDDRPDLIVLDVMLPGYNGLEILAELRRRGERVPVLILSARDRTAQKVEGLGLGADDYLAKPFELSELLARCEALLRRRRNEREDEPEIIFGAVRIDPAGRSVTRDGRPLALSAKEFDLLCLLARAPGRVLDREAILDRVWGFGFDGTARTVDNFISSLRQKIEPDPSRPRHIVTVRGVGYKLEP